MAKEGGGRREKGKGKGASAKIGKGQIITESLKKVFPNLRDPAS